MSEIVTRKETIVSDVLPFPKDLIKIVFGYYWAPGINERKVLKIYETSLVFIEDKLWYCQKMFLYQQDMMDMIRARSNDDCYDELDVVDDIIFPLINEYLYPED